MAIIYVRPTNGSDANSGLTYALAKQTIAGAVAILTATDEICLAGDEGNHVVNSTVTCNVNLNMYTYAGHTRAVITGTAAITGTIGSVIARDISMQNGTTGNVTIGSSTSGSSMHFRNVDFYRQVSIRPAAGSRHVFDNCKLLYGIDTSTRTVSALAYAASPAGYCEFSNCDITGRLAPTATAFTFANIKFLGNRIYYNPNTSGAGLFRLTAEPPVMSWDYNTIDDINSLIEYNSASAVSTNNLTFKRNYIKLAGQILSNIGAGALTMESVGSSSDNILDTGTGTTGYSSIGDTTTSAPEFYDATNHDYRIEITSPLANYNSDTVGAFIPDWDSFWSDVPEAKVETGYAYRVRSRTNNKTGTLSATGETDTTKVLTTSTAVAGQYVAPSAANVKTGISFGVADTGTYDGSDRWTDPGIANVRSGTAYKANSVTNNRTGTAAIPVAGDVRFSVATDATTGTVVVPTAANTKIGVAVDVADTGTYDGSDRWTDVGISNVRSGSVYKANSVTNNRTGTAVIPAASDVRFGTAVDATTGTAKIPTAANTKIGVAVDVADTGTYDGSDRWSDPLEINVKSGVAYKANSVTNNKTGNRTDASSANVLSGTGTYGANGTEFTPSYTPDFPDVANVTPDDTVNGAAGTLDLPALNRVSPNDTLRGVPGTQDLPSLNSILTTDTLEGAAGTVTLPAVDDVVDGTLYGANNSLEGTAIELDLFKFTDVPEDKVSTGYMYKYNSATDNREGTADVGSNSTDPGESNVLKHVDYIINGVNKTGLYDTGIDTPYTSDKIRIKILQEIEQTLYRINPAVSGAYESTVKSVSFESGETQGLLQDDIPHVQIVADDSVYDHKYVLSGNRPGVTMKVKLIVTTPASWNQLDSETLYEDIRQAFIRDNFSLNGLVQTTKLDSINMIRSDSDKQDDNRKAAIGLILNYIELINE